MMGRWPEVSTSSMKKDWHYGAHIQHEKGLALWKVICRPYIQARRLGSVEGAYASKSHMQTSHPRRGGLVLWREHRQEEDLCRPHIQASRLGLVRRNIGNMSHIQDKEAWPCQKMMISSKQGRLGSEERLIQCWLALSTMTKLLARFEDEATRRPPK